MNKTLSFGILALIAVGLIGTGALATAHEWNGPFLPAKQAIQNQDFDAFKAATENHPGKWGDLTEEDFPALVERHQQHIESRQAFIQALNDQDYDAWKAAMESLEREPKFEITEESFTTLVALHEAREARDFETMRTLKEDLGLEFGRMNKFSNHGHFRHFGMGG